MKAPLICILFFFFYNLHAQETPQALLTQLSSVPLLKGASQALIILGEDPAKTTTEVVLCEKIDNVWTVLPGTFPAVVGKKGFAAFGAKKEGDGKSPTGVFTLSLAFGYAPVCDTKMPYRQATTNDFWVDDPQSPLYNTWVAGKPAAKSMEKMHRNDILYQWGIVVDYNTSPVVPGEGSAIFLHLWKKPGTYTSGCAAFSEDNMLRVLKWLDPDKKPVVVMGVPHELEKLVQKE